jgi:hypothetical protein
VIIIYTMDNTFSLSDNTFSLSDNTFYLKGTKLPYHNYNRFEWEDNILYLYYKANGTENSEYLTKDDIIKNYNDYIPYTDNKELQQLINDIRGGNQSTPEKLTPENNELIEIFKDGKGSRLDFDLGTKVYLDRNTIYDKDNMYIITKKYGPFKTVEVIKTGGSESSQYNIIIYKYDLQNINDENKTIEKAFNVFEAKNLELNGVISNDTTIKENINDKIDGKTDKIDGKTIKKIVKDEGEYIYTGADNDTSGFEAEYKDRHFITFDNGEEVEFTGEVNEINGNNQKAGKRKTRRNRKSKKGKRSRKARKSRRKSSRRRGRR